MNTFFSLLMQNVTLRTGSPIYIPKRSQMVKNKIRRARAQRNKRK